MNAIQTQREVVVESWVDMRGDTSMRYVVSQSGELVTLYFGAQESFVLSLGRDNLARFVELAARALAECDDSAGLSV